MFSTIRTAIINSIKSFDKNIVLTPDNVLIDEPRNEQLGDIYTNAAMLFAKKVGANTKQLAEKIAENLQTIDIVSSVNIDGPGFINIRLKNSYWQSIIGKIIKLGHDFSYSALNIGKKVLVEFVSANPTGPLHTGHARNAVFGSVAANLLEKIGYDVTREFYINDQGNQIKNMARSVYLRYIELLGQSVSDSQFTENMYCGEYIKDVAHAVIDKYNNIFLNKPENEWLDILCRFSIDYMMNSIKKELADAGVVMDVYTSEADVCRRNLVNDALKILEERGDIYEGILPKPKGTIAEDWEERPQTLFQSTKYGDEIDRAIKKSDGTWTYFAGDLAYHLDKFQRGFSKMLNIFGADHNGYVKRLKAAVSAISNGQADLEVRLYQLVNFLENGVPIRMSKRKGNFITLRDVVNRVGKDVMRYMMISRHHDVMIDFDFKKAVEFSMDNPLFYIQYAHARICSVFRNYESVFGKKVSDNELSNANLSMLTDESELKLSKILSFWPERVKSSAIAIEPHRIPIYLRDIVAQFHSLWNKGKANENLRFINKNNIAVTFARMALLRATQSVISDGLEILGITPMDEMKPLTENSSANEQEIEVAKDTTEVPNSDKNNLDEPYAGIILPDVLENPFLEKIKRP